MISRLFCFCFYTSHELEELVPTEMRRLRRLLHKSAALSKLNSATGGPSMLMRIRQSKVESVQTIF